MLQILSLVVRCIFYSNLNGKPSAAIVLKQSFGSNANQVEDVKPN
jgi:hypothetical protein